MVEIEGIYRGDLRVEATHGPSGVRLITDAPVDNQGKGESFSPTDLLATALGSCMLTIMGIMAERHDWPLKGSTYRVEKHMVADPQRRVGKLVIAFHLPAALAEDARGRLEKAARTCPVHHSIHPETEVEVAYHYDL